MEATQQDIEDCQASDEFKSPTKIIKEWVPTCEEVLAPKQGLIFDDLDQCENFYKTYAHRVGFSVRKSSCKKNKEGVEIIKYFVCSKQGFKESSTSTKGK